VSGTGESFRTTRWSLVRAVGGVDPERARRALEELCASYWFPLYAFARRSGLSPEDAEDCTQGFLVRLLERRDLERVEVEGGRFRSFLRVALRRHIASEREREGALKRGGGARPVSIDLENAERRVALEIPDHETPERAFDRAWAQALLARVFATLRAEYTSRGKELVFERLEADLLGNCSADERRAIAAELELSEGALDVARHRLRRRFGEALRSEIGETLQDPAGIDAELAALMELLAPA